MSAYWKSILKSEHKKTEVQQEARRMKEENYEVVVFQGDPGTIDLTYEEIEAEWNKMLQSVPQIGKFRIIHQEKKRYTFEDYSSQIGNADAALGIWVHKGVINEKLFEAHPNLKYIATLGHGFEDFDVEMTRRRGLTITNTIYGDVTIAQYAMALLMNICHNVTVQSDYTKTGTGKKKKRIRRQATINCSCRRLSSTRKRWESSDLAQSASGRQEWQRALA